MPPAPRPAHPLRLEALALLLFFFSLSLLAWSGTFHSSDGLSMYAVSDALVRYGRWDTETIRWMDIQQGTIGPDGLLYSRKGVATSLLALPLTWLGFALPDIGPVHATLLLTPLLHALTALYLYYATRRLLPGIGRGGALAIACLWAFGSMAIAYVKTFFSEPAVALATVGALFHLVRLRDGGEWRDAAAVGGWLGLSLLTRSANAIVFPFFGLALLAYTFQSWLDLPVRGRARYIGGWRAPLRTWDEWLLHEWTLTRVAAFLLPILVSGLLYLWYNWLRFGDPLTSGYIEGEEFSAIWWQGIVGLTVSPGRGLLWYTPWLPLTLLGARRFWARDRVLTALLTGSVLLYILFYGKWYLWSGGYSWGARFLVPILPFLALLAAPLLQRDGRRAPLLGGWPALLALLGLLGLLVNLVGVLWDFDLHQQVLDASGLPPFDWQTFVQPRYSQILGLWEAGRARPWAIDLAWMVEGFAERRIVGLMLAILLAGVGAGSLVWRRQAGGRVLAAGAMLVTVALWLMLGDLRAFQAPAVQDALALLPDPLPADAQLWYDDPPATEAVLNRVKQRLPIVGFYVDGPTIDEAQRYRAAARALDAPGPIYLLTDGPEPLQNGLDRLLLDTLFPLGSSHAGPYRVASYWQGPLSEPIRYDRRLAFPESGFLTLREGRVTPEVAPGQVLALALLWEIEAPLPADTQLFMQLYNEAGERVAQLDAPPTHGLSAPEGWSPGDLIATRHALRLPPDLPPGPYTLHAGLYRLSDGARAADSAGQGEIVLPIAVR